MGMVVRTNTMSNNAYRQLGMNNTQLSKSLEKLSSGFRINRAGDDSSGLAISEKMKAQISGLDQASANSQDGISLVQTAEGALTEVHSMLNRMVTLADKSANGTIQNQVDRDAIQTETNALKEEITRVSKSTNFNGIALLDGSLSSNTVNASMTLATGASVAGAKTAAVAFAGTYTPGGSDTTIGIKFNDADGNSVTIDATGLTAGFTGAQALTALKAADSSAYDKLTSAYKVETSGSSITFTALKAGANGKVEAAATSGAAASIATTAGANAKSTVTLGAAIATGDTFTVGGTTYTVGATADADKHVVANLADLKTQVEATGDYTVSGTVTGAGAAGNSVVFTSTKTANGGLTLQVGDTNEDYNKVTVAVDDMSAAGLGIASLDVSTQEKAGSAIATIKTAINTVSTNRGNLGALQNRLEHAISNLDTTSENMNAANSAIRDTDMAKEMMNYTKMNILSQAAQAMLAQANQQPQNILQLLK